MKNNPAANVKYRPPTPDDLDLIMGTWLAGLRHSEPYMFVDNKTYYMEHSKVIEAVLNKSLVTIICDPGDESHLYGYLVYELPNIIHAIYVKPAFRFFGLARAVIEKQLGEMSELILTAMPPNKFRIKPDGNIGRRSAFVNLRYRYNLKYNPYLLMKETK